MAEDLGRAYFAYGSNMDEQQMRYRCPRSEALGVARLDGYRFLINLRGVATVIPQAASTVWGVLWRLDPADEKTLDSYEGVPKGLYLKEEVTVECPDSGAVRALVYMAAVTAPGTARGGYMERLVDEAVAKQFPQAYIEELRSWLRR